MNIFFQKCNRTFKIMNKTGKNHEQILFNLTKLIYTYASGHVNF